MSSSNPASFNIKDTSSLTGLSPSVLRIWELRYGWPRPGRLPNGYRYFTRYQIEELKRMSALVKSGMLISRLIQDGMPKWPAEFCEPVKIVFAPLDVNVRPAVAPSVKAPCDAPTRRPRPCASG